jgi:hypothetical protein
VSPWAQTASLSVRLQIRMNPALVKTVSLTLHQNPHYLILIN